MQRWEAALLLGNSTRVMRRGCIEILRKSSDARAKAAEETQKIRLRLLPATSFAPAHSSLECSRMKSRAGATPTCCRAVQWCENNHQFERRSRRVGISFKAHTWQDLRPRECRRSRHGCARLTCVRSRATTQSQSSNLDLVTLAYAARARCLARAIHSPHVHERVEEVLR